MAAHYIVPRVANGVPPVSKTSAGPAAPGPNRCRRGRRSLPMRQCGRTADSAQEILELLELELGAMMPAARTARPFGRRRRRATRDALHHSQRTQRADRAYNAGPGHCDHFSQAADEFTHSAQGIGSAGAPTPAARRRAGAAAHEAQPNPGSPPRNPPAIANVVNLIAQIGKETTSAALTPHRGGASRRRGRGFAVVASRSRRSRCRPRVHRGNYEKNRRAAAGRRGFGRCGATGFTGESRRSDRYSKNVNGAVRSRTKPPARYPIKRRLRFALHRFGRRRAAEIDGATKEAEAHGESVEGAARPSPCSRRSSKALRGVLRQGEPRRPAQSVPAAVPSQHEFRPRAA